NVVSKEGIQVDPQKVDVTPQKSLRFKEFKMNSVERSTKVSQDDSPNNSWKMSWE
ncbi:hypothetical protein HAX54_025338, partial [Datura stramonium]|nr:hypothetical protein [Datura stramonium]